MHFHAVMEHNVSCFSALSRGFCFNEILRFVTYLNFAKLNADSFLAKSLELSTYFHVVIVECATWTWDFAGRATRSQ
jgi:hypothetical protein